MANISWIDARYSLHKNLERGQDAPRIIHDAPQRKSTDWLIRSVSQPSRQRTTSFRPTQQPHWPSVWRMPVSGQERLWIGRHPWPLCQRKRAAGRHKGSSALQNDRESPEIASGFVPYGTHKLAALPQSVPACLSVQHLLRRGQFDTT